MRNLSLLLVLFTLPERSKSYKANHGANNRSHLVLTVFVCQERVGNLFGDGKVAQFEQLNVPVIGNEALDDRPSASSVLTCLIPSL